MNEDNLAGLKFSGLEDGLKLKLSRVFEVWSLEYQPDRSMA